MTITLRLCTAVLLPFSLIAAIEPLALDSAANTAFRDDQPNDRTGGWVDLGSNDLRDIPHGSLLAAGIPFSISAHTDQACIVLGGPTRSYLPKKTTLAVDPQRSGKTLYLLHGAAFVPEAQAMAGILTIEYANGKKKEFHVRQNRDVADWQKPTGYKNCARAWTTYNANTQVSLFVSKFALESAPVARIVFEAKEATWMIAAVSLGDDAMLRPILPNLAITQTVKPAPALTAALPVETNTATPRNIILLIGDGMGHGALRLTSLATRNADDQLVLQQMPFNALCTTYSFSDEVTDSAASGTAIACGQKTKNGMIATSPTGQQLESAATLAKKQGRSIGIMTSDSLLGATPAVFYAHNKSRGSYQNIANDSLLSTFDILIGNAGGLAWFLPKSASGSKRNDDRALLPEFSAQGYMVITNISSFAQVPAQQKVLGFIDYKGELSSEPCLGQLLDTALTRLNANPKGFFIMLESSMPDSGGHGNKPDLTIMGTTQIDWAARAALEFARKHQDTLVLVTADHETGGIQSIRTKTGALTLRYTTTSHTSTPVDLYAFGPSAHRIAGNIDNTDIGKLLRELLAK